jgi:hypothetical protein
VDDPRHLTGGDAGRLEHAQRALDHAARVVVGGRQHLAGVHAAVRCEQHDVGERAADVDAEPVLGRRGRARSVRAAVLTLTRWHA